MSWGLIAFFGGIVALLAFDLYLVLKGGVQATISYELYTFTQANPIVGVIMGVFVGHLFWPNPGGCK